jgi:hypothetical protein
MVSRSAVIVAAALELGGTGYIHTLLFQFVELSHDHGHINPGSRLIPAQPGLRQRIKAQPRTPRHCSGLSTMQQQVGSLNPVVVQVTDAVTGCLRLHSEVLSEQLHLRLSTRPRPQRRPVMGSVGVGCLRVVEDHSDQLSG